MDNRVCLASVETGLVVVEVDEHSGHVNSVAFSRTGNLVIAGGQDGIARL